MNKREEEFESKYHAIMNLLRRSRMNHGDCNSIKRYNGLPKACAACMANIEIEKQLAEYQGRTVRLSRNKQF